MKSSIKKMSALLTMMAVAILTFTFTACSDDDVVLICCVINRLCSIMKLHIVIKKGKKSVLVNIMSCLLKNFL